MLRGERPVKRWAPCGPSNQHPHGLDTGFEVFEVTSAIHRGAPQRERARPPDPRSRAIVAMMRDDEQSAPPPRPDPARCSITNPHSIRNRGPRRGVRVGIITLSWLLVYQAPDDHSDTDGAHEATDRPAPRGSGPARACTAQSHGHGAARSDHDGGPTDPQIPFLPSKTRHAPLPEQLSPHPEITSSYVSTNVLSCRRSVRSPFCTTHNLYRHHARDIPEKNVQIPIRITSEQYCAITPEDAFTWKARTDAEVATSDGGDHARRSCFPPTSPDRRRRPPHSQRLRESTRRPSLDSSERHCVAERPGPRSAINR